MLVYWPLTQVLLFLSPPLVSAHQSLCASVRAFHLSFGYLVEVDIVLPEDMRLREAHDIGEALQIKFESLPDVERAVS